MRPQLLVLHDADGPYPAVRGTLLRHVLLSILDQAARPMTTEELHGALRELGLSTFDRPSRSIPDALRTERVRGRVVRVDRSTFTIGRLPKVTRHRAHRRTRDLRHLLASDRLLGLPPGGFGPAVLPVPADRP